MNWLKLITDTETKSRIKGKVLRIALVTGSVMGVKTRMKANCSFMLGKDLETFLVLEL